MISLVTCSWMKKRGVERNVMNERQNGSLLFFLPVVNINDPSHTHTAFTQPLLLTQDCVWFIGHRIPAAVLLRKPPSLSPMRKPCIVWKLLDRCLLWDWHSFSCLQIHSFFFSCQTSHTYSQTHMEVLSLVCLCACLCCLRVWFRAIGSHIATSSQRIGPKASLSAPVKER